jgi:hypothetical protein
VRHSRPEQRAAEGGREDCTVAPWPGRHAPHPQVVSVTQEAAREAAAALGMMAAAAHYDGGLLPLLCRRVLCGLARSGTRRAAAASSYSPSPVATAASAATGAAAAAAMSASGQDDDAGGGSAQVPTWGAARPSSGSGAGEVMRGRVVGPDHCAAGVTPAFAMAHDGPSTAAETPGGLAPDELAVAVWAVARLTAGALPEVRCGTVRYGTVRLLLPPSERQATS